MDSTHDGGPDDDHGARVNAWVNVVRRARLPATTKLIALLMATYASADGTSIYPGNARLAVESGHGYRTVQRELARLRAMGLVEQMPRAGLRRGWSVPYRLILGPDVLDKVDIMTPAAEEKAVEAVAGQNRERFRKHYDKRRRTRGRPVDNSPQDGTTKRHLDGVRSADLTPQLWRGPNATPNSPASDDDPPTLPVPLPMENPPSDEADHRDPGTGIAREAPANGKPVFSGGDPAEDHRQAEQARLATWIAEHPESAVP